MRITNKLSDSPIKLNVINDSNYLGIRGWTSSNNWSTNALFKFFQNGGFNITTNI